MLEPSRRLDAALDVPWELFEYARWLEREGAAGDDYLFAEARARFEARDGDVLRGPGDLVVQARAGRVELRSARLGGSIAIAGVERATAERLLGAIDGHRTLAELRVRAGSDRPALDRLVRAALGSVLFAPEAVAELEARLSGAELVRFVGTPYELVRAYWQNMIGVRRAAEATLGELDGDERALAWLRRLHVIALLGAELDSFYRPASRITARGVAPGALLTSATHRVATESGVLLLSGPRVGAGFAAGERYFAEVFRAAGDAEASSAARALTDADGLSWGEIVTGRAVDDAGDAPWFCPPRPLRAEHWQKLFAPLRAALSASEAERAGDELGRFHYRFVRLHPFRAANQSLAMNLVNLALGRTSGAGIPHLWLDQLALRLSEPAYLVVFRLALRGHCVPGEPTARWAALRERRLRAESLIARIGRAGSEPDAAALIAHEPDAARLALIAV